MVVRAGTSTVQLPESATTMTSADRSARFSSRKFLNVGEPASSSPSINSVRPRSKSGPAIWARVLIAAKWVTIPALSSAAPRP